MNLSVPDRPFAVRPTTWIEPEKLRAALGLRITLVSETFQRTGSFKFRAAFHRARTASARHLIAASSGNFGQALALACRLLRKEATIVMPSISARVKIEAVRSHGAAVELTDVEKESREEGVARVLASFPEAEGGERLRRSGGHRRQRDAGGRDRRPAVPFLAGEAAEGGDRGPDRRRGHQLRDPHRARGRGDVPKSPSLAPSRSSRTTPPSPSAAANW